MKLKGECPRQLCDGTTIAFWNSLLVIYVPIWIPKNAPCLPAYLPTYLFTYHPFTTFVSPVGSAVLPDQNLQVLVLEENENEWEHEFNT